MERLEFNEVMKAIEINNPLSTTMGRYGSNEYVHYWNELAIWFSGSSYAIIHGKIPFEVANIIYEKYPNNPYYIRVDGGGQDWKPIDYAIDSVDYEDVMGIPSYMKGNLSVYERTQKSEQLKKDLEERNNDEKYLTIYHIDTKEGLIIFLTEMKDYLLRKNNLPETEVAKYNELLAEINFEILKKINPSISAYDWMQGDSKNKNSYNETIERDSKTKLGQLFRKAILDFDKAVNPFLDEDLNFDKVKDYLKKVDISVSNEDEKNRKGCCALQIFYPNTQNRINYHRRPEGFSFQIKYTLGNQKYLNVLHYYSPSKQYGLDSGEIIVIHYFGDNIEKEINIRLNITTGKAGTTYGDKNIATMEQIAFVYDELLKATSYASSITIENMKKNESTKKLLLKNN